MKHLEIIMSKKKEELPGDVKKFTVKRKRWLRGKGSDESRLLTNSNKMCCLGFYARACGLSTKQIKDQSSPENAAFIYTYSDDDYYASPEKDKVWKTKLINKYGRDTATCSSLMETNDDEDMKDSVREKKIKSLFKKLGITVKFED